MKFPRRARRLTSDLKESNQEKDEEEEKKEEEEEDSGYWAGTTG